MLAWELMTNIMNLASLVYVNKLLLTCMYPSLHYLLQFKEKSIMPCVSLGL